jgi:hypothetical protein
MVGDSPEPPGEPRDEQEKVGHALDVPWAVDALEAELAETIVAVAERASGLHVRVGIADGKFAAYVAAVLGMEAMATQPSRTGGNDEEL